MDVKELLKLMIGDILIAYYDDGEKQYSFPVVIDGIDENCTLVYGGHYVSWKSLLPEHKYEEYADELTPIPLTEEILKKNGWKCCDGWFERNDVDFFIAKCVDKYKLCQVFHMRSFATIAYVHELQHALRLCGLNELADNIKV